MTHFEIRWSDDRFDHMKPEDRLEAVRTLIEHGTLDFGDGSMSDVYVREVTAGTAGTGGLLNETYATMQARQVALRPDIDALFRQSAQAEHSA